jgi:hypothetical protein
MLAKPTNIANRKRAGSDDNFPTPREKEQRNPFVMFAGNEGPLSSLKIANLAKHAESPPIEDKLSIRLTKFVT